MRKAIVISLTMLLVTTAAYKCFAWDDGYYSKSLYSSIDLSTHSFDRLAAIIEQLKEGCSKETRKASEYDWIIDHASRTYEVDPDLIRAVIKAESNFDADSTSSKGAMGLMQLMPQTAKDLGVTNPYDPVENITGGTRYLKNLLVQFEDCIPLALAAYNAGCTPVKKHEGIPPFPETKAYVERVLKCYQSNAGKLKRHN